jgi:hypothetical protein
MGMAQKRKPQSQKRWIWGSKRESAFKQGEKRLIKRYCGVPLCDTAGLYKVPNFFGV